MNPKFQEKSQMKIFLSYFKPHKKLFFLDIFCAFCIAMVDLAFPLVSRHAMYELLPNHAYAVFFTWMGAMVVAFTIRAVLHFVVSYWGHTFGIRVEADIRQDLFGHMQTLSYGYFDQNRTGQLMNHLTSDLFDITELAHHGPEDLFIAIVTIVGALAVMFCIQWQLALVVAIIIPIFLAVLMMRRRSMSQAAVRVKMKTGMINTDLESALTGMRTAKAFANESQEMDKFNQSNNGFKTSKSQFHRAMGAFVANMEFFMTILSVAVIGVGGYLIMEGTMHYVDLLTFSLYITAFITPVRKMSTFAELFSAGFAGFGRFVNLMRTEPTIQDKKDAKVLGRAKGDVSLSHVSFTYDDDQREVLHGVSLDIQAGETVALVGPSGGGKTTLCQLIPRFYDVTAGSITVDGFDLRDVTQQSLHKNIGIVQQDVFLFADSILENIRYGTPGATKEQVMEAAKQAEIYDDIMAMTNGFDTYVGERGTLLSGGQKQRISIARIFLKNPPILILDEATSALDSVTESKIQKAFDQLSQGRTTLIIAHRLSTIRSASRILVVSDGIVAEEGTHTELLQKNGAYAQLYRTQCTI